MKMDQEYYNNLLDSLDFAIAEHEMIYDDNGNAIDYRYLYVNQRFCDIMGLSKEEIIGKAAYEYFANVEQTWLYRYKQVVETGEPVSFTNYTKEVGKYFHVYAYRSKENCFVTSFRDISSLVRSVLDDTHQVDLVSNLFETSKTAYFEFDLKQKIFDYSEVLADIIGMDIITYEDYVNLFEQYMHQYDKDRFSTRMGEVFSGKASDIGMQVRFYHQKLDRYVWISFFAFVDERYRGIPIKLRGLIKDIDAEKKLELEMDSMERLFRETRRVANIATFYYMNDTEQFRPSKEMDEFTGVDHLVDINQMRSIIHPEDLDDYDYSTREIKNFPDGMITNFRIIKNNQIRFIQSSIFAHIGEDGIIDGVFGIMKDITEIEQSKRDIEYFANHDILTGLYNRNNFEKASEQLDDAANVCVFICDVDGLKLINDAFGHIEGDQLLVHLANILTDAVGHDNVYRIGGDEFVLIVRNKTEDELRDIEIHIKDEVQRFRIYGVGFDVSTGYHVKDTEEAFEDAFRNAENLMYRRKLTERKSRKSTALSTIMQTLHERTEETEEHCIRVGDLSSELLKSIGRKRDYELEEIRLIAMVHDIGKISISDKILNKPDKLTPLEFSDMKYHSESGYKIVSNILDNEDIAIAVLYHHEKYDGSGYPHSLKGEQIPLYSRIIAICDAYDAMTSNRVYRDAMTKKMAIKELKEHAGTQFDPMLVEKFLQIVKKR